MMKTALALVMLLAGISVGARASFAQTPGSPAEKDFVSGGRVAITLESGDYEIRASTDNRIHVRWNEASGARVKLATNGNSADLRVENTPNNNFTPLLRSRRLLTCAFGLLLETCEFLESKATKILK
jgi:hypothetical protein